MARTSIKSAVLLFVAAAVALPAFAADSKPRLPAGGGGSGPPAAKPKPAGADGKPSAVDGSQRVGLSNGLLTFLPPDGWLDSPTNRTPTRELYFAPTKDARMLVELLPANSDAGPEAAVLMVRKLKQSRAANKQKFVQEPTIEKDDRFAVRIRERFEALENGSPQTQEQLHLYRKVGDRVVMVTLRTASPPERTAEQQAQAEKVSLSIEGPAGAAAPATAKPPKPPAKPK